MACPLGPGLRHTRRETRMKPKVAAAVEFVVGLFLSPAAWVMLVAMTAGRAAMNSLNSLSTAGLADPSLGVEPPPAADVPMPGWLTALLVVSAVVTPAGRAVLRLGRLHLGQAAHRRRPIRGGGRLTRRRRQSDRRARLASDAARLTGFGESVLADADRLGVPVPPIVRWTVTVWRAWADLLGEHASS